MNIYQFINKKHAEPVLVTLPEPIRVIGVSERTNENTIFKDARELGKRYDLIKKSGVIPHKRDPWAFAALSRDYRDDGSWEYLMGDVVTSLDTIPTGLSECEIPAGLYARFAIQPRFAFLWGPALGLTKKFIFSEWLPTSGYELDGSVVGDFEYHDQRSLGKNAEIELYVSIRKLDKSGKSAE